MRRPVLITAFALLLAVPVWAQHGGGGHGGGGHAGGFGGGHSFGGGHVGFSGGGHVVGGRIGGFSGIRSGGGVHSFSRVPTSQRSFSRTPYLHDSFRGSRFHDRGFRDHHRRFSSYNTCYGYGYGCRGYGYPYWGYGYYPWMWDWWDDHQSAYDEGYERDRAVAADMNRQNLEEQEMFRREEADGDQDAYAPPRAPHEQTAEEKPGSPVLPATVLVYRDQHTQEVQNYAIVGQTLWNFGARTQKISLADLDVPATVKANDERGMSFRVPFSNQGQ